VVRFLADALSGDKVNRRYDTFTVDGFSLRAVPEIRPRVLVAALRPRMLQLAGAEADGAILSWMSPSDVRVASAIVRQAGPDKAVVSRIVVCPTGDRTVAAALARRAIAAYLTVPVYRASQEWLGRGPQLQETWERWDTGDRSGALHAIPDEVVDDVVVHGTPDECRAKLAAYFAAGLTTASISLLLPQGLDHASALSSLAPEARSEA
jgi:alkanesulfonate monooxygenase SsuD/methylene tetrahydromethanopterin reductase-like flavin-dependent oxidoreductase (luciferase family)